MLEYASFHQFSKKYLILAVKYGIFPFKYAFIFFKPVKECPKLKNLHFGSKVIWNKIRNAVHLKLSYIEMIIYKFTGIPVIEI